MNMEEQQMKVSFNQVLYSSIKEIEDVLNTLCKVPFEEKPNIVEEVTPQFLSTSYYIMSLAKKRGWKPMKMAGFLDSLWEISPAAVFSILVREIAIELDKKYEDHINKCDTLYIISTFDGRIHQVHRKAIKSFKNFAAFRTEDDAKAACRILRSELKEMFKSGRKQENKEC